MSKSIKEISKLASEWWADKVINPKFENSDDNSNGEFTITVDKYVNSESRNKFIENLSKSIEDSLNQNKRKIILDVDYCACKELKEAGEYAGISKDEFPLKTTMLIDKNHISVRHGCGTKEKYLYENKTYWKSQIVSCNELIEKYRGGEYLSWIKDENERKEHEKESISDIEKDIKEYQNNLENAEE